MSTLLRAFKQSLFVKKSGKYKVETFSSGAAQVKFYTEDEFDKLCDEEEARDAEALKKQRENEEASKKLEAEASLKSLDYIRKCSAMHDKLKHEDYKCFFATIFKDKLEVTPVWISEATEEWRPSSSFYGNCGSSKYELKKVRCIVAENTYLHHERAFGGEGCYYKYVIVEDDSESMNAFAATSSNLAGYFLTRESLQAAVDEHKEHEILKLEAMLAEKKELFSKWSF